VAFHVVQETGELWCLHLAEVPLGDYTDFAWRLGEWHRGEARQLYWRSKWFLAPERAHFTALRLRASGYPVDAVLLWQPGRIWGAGAALAALDDEGQSLDLAARCPLRVTNAQPWRLPARVPPVDVWALEVRSRWPVVEVALGTSPAELER